MSPAPRARRRVRYPWRKLEEEDSFLLPYAELGQIFGGAGAVQTAGRDWCRRNRASHTIVCRDVGGGYRFWLVRNAEDQIAVDKP